MDNNNIAKALIDGKDIAPEFETYLDDEKVARKKNRMLGYICGIPAECSWQEDDNVLLFSALKETDTTPIVERIEIMVSEWMKDVDNELLYTIEKESNNIRLSFWWR